MNIKKNYLFTVILSLCVISSCAQNQNVRQTEIEKRRETFWKNLPKPIGWTNDWAELFDVHEEKTLDSLIGVFNKKTTIEISIVTIDTMNVSKEKFQKLTLHIANTWGIGDKNKNNGILIGISPGYRTIRIENGYGIEKLIDDDETKKVIDNSFIPSFKNKKYYQETLIGLRKLMELLENKLSYTKQ